MEPTLIWILLAVVAVIFVAALGLRRSDRTLPKGKDTPELDAGPERDDVEQGTQPLPDAALIPGDIAPSGTPLDRSGRIITSAAEPALAPIARTDEDVAVLRKGLASTRGGFISRLARVFGRKPEIDPSLLDEIEEVLITADVGMRTSQKILSRLRERMERNELANADRMWDAIRDEARDILSTSSGTLKMGNKPTVLLVVGVNGVGKTTTIGKLASRFTEQGKKVVLAAGDTFRAAAVLQLEVWGRRVGCEVAKGKERSDPGAVIFDAIKKAQAEGADVVIADTAGRLHTKTPLMDELKKLGRTIEKATGREADEVLLVLDATTGQNAIQQAQLFKEALPVSGIVLTKLDGTAKGGVILGIADEHRIPVRFIGIGERVEDLKEFDSRSFVEALFEKPDDESLAA